MNPVGRAERINSVDVLRGFALLGILLLNILSFGLPFSAFSPLNAGKATAANTATWAIVTVLFDGKMRALFSMLFGAGAILMTSRAAARGAQADIADVWLRRSMWLMAMGAAHAWFLWDGDILFSYGLVALFLYPFRKLRPAALIAMAAFILAMQAGRQWGDWYEQRIHKTEAEIAAAVEGTRLPLMSELKDGKEAWEDARQFLAPPADKIAKEEKLHRSGYLAIFSSRAESVPTIESLSFYTTVFPDASAMMLIGMALLQSGVLTLQRSRGFYLALMVAGFGVGLPLAAWDAWRLWESHFDVLVLTASGVHADISRTATALGFAALVMLVCQAGRLLWLTRRLAAVGQMALTNYILHSVICTTLFYGYGFGLYGKLERYQLYFVVVAVWAFQLILSPIWLRYFLYGPLEWVWRSLTYWKPQPMRVKTLQAAGAAAR